MKIENILERHVEEYDRDCSTHEGCSCGWEPPEENDRLAVVRSLWRDHLSSIIEEAFEWTPTRWWRAVDVNAIEGEPPSSAIWCESSDEAEVRAAARDTDVVMRLEQSIRVRWVAMPESCRMPGHRGCEVIAGAMVHHPETEAVS